jgi:PqqD family protein of HPr-rel-A system
MVSEAIMKKLKTLAVSDTGFIFDPATGSSYTLNETAARMFQLLKEGRNEEELLHSLMAEYEVDLKTLEFDFFDFINQLKYLGLVNRNLLDDQI